MHAISTLRPDKIKPSDFMDISGMWAVRPYIQSIVKDVAIRYAFSRQPMPFPLGTHGFFYYVRPKPEQAISGEVRFRITPEADPTSFTRGHDLSKPKSLPWALPVVGLAKNYVPTCGCSRS